MPPRVYVRGSGGERSWCPPRRERGAGSPTIGVMEPRTDADVVIVGGSLAGCAAARRLALAGARVVVIEQRPGRAAYKRLCGHYIQAGATPEIERLGLVAPLEAAGAVRNAVDVCTPAGWIRRPALPHGYSIRREVLDPLVRRLATETPGVTYRGGLAVRDLVREGGRVIGVVATDRDRRPAAFRARLVVAADGRRSTVARLAGVPAASAPNHRCCFFAYWRGLDEPGRVWRLGRDVVLAVPNDDGLTILALFAHRDRLPELTRDLDGGLRAAVRALPEAPAVDRARRVSKILGYKEHVNLWRPAAPGAALALVGDAAMSLDPVPAIGCGWALESAGWLADAVGPALRGEDDLDAALDRYGREHECRLGGHRALIAEAALAGPPSAPQARLARAAVHDAEAARVFFRLATRMAPVEEILTPAALARFA